MTIDMSVIKLSMLWVVGVLEFENFLFDVVKLGKIDQREVRLRLIRLQASNLAVLLDLVQFEYRRCDELVVKSQVLLAEVLACLRLQ